MTGLAPETILAVVVVGLLAISATSEVSRRTGVATPLLLVALGIGVGFIPGMPPIDIEQWYRDREEADRIFGDDRIEY